MKWVRISNMSTTKKSKKKSTLLIGKIIRTFLFITLCVYMSFENFQMKLKSKKKEMELIKEREVMGYLNLNETFI